MAKKSKIVIVCKSNQYHGKSMNLPTIGETQISKEGEIEVESELADMLVTGTNDWSYKDSSEDPNNSQYEGVESSEENDNDSSEESFDEGDTEKSEEADEEDIDEEQMDKELTKKMVKSFSDEELKSMAAKYKIQKTVIGKAKSKGDLIKMILNKLSVTDKGELLGNLAE